MTTQSSEGTTSSDSDSREVMKDLVKGVIAMFELLSKSDQLPPSRLSPSEKRQKR
jgi:hypothetical protein